MTVKSNDILLIDVGSSTVKVYKYSNSVLNLFLSRSFHFKDGFSEELGISESNKTQLISLIRDLSDKHKGIAINIYATALFRKMKLSTRNKFIQEFREHTGCVFNIISHEQENHYLELALVGNYASNQNVLLINIGGGSTELIVMQDKEAIERHNIDLGVGTILKEFPNINARLSEIALTTLVNNLNDRLPALTNTTKLAFYTGGELTYMEIAGYTLRNNSLFVDPNHPKIITSKDFAKRNADVFSKVTLEELENLMPENPKWMHGARSCSALAQAIIEKYKIETLIPSNANLIDGVVYELENKVI